jgi:iron complex outermembrane receptor protein
MGKYISGVNVMVKGATVGVITDINGNFSIQVEQGKTLVFSYIGYDTHEVIVSKEIINRVK